MPLCIPALAFSLCLSVSLYPHSQWECSPRPRDNEGRHLYISLPKFCCPDIATFETTCMRVCMLSHSVVFDSLQPRGWQPTRLLCPWDSQGKDTGVSCHFLLQGIFLTQGSNLGLLHWQADPLPLNHLEDPTPPRMNPNVNYGLCVIMMWWYMVISCNKCTTLMGDVDDRGDNGCMMLGNIWELFVPFS